MEKPKSRSKRITPQPRRRCRDKLTIEALEAFWQTKRIPDYHSDLRFHSRSPQSGA
jgi:hypothetical protein